MDQPVKWTWRTWDELSKSELYRLMKLRQEIFVIEQQVIYQQMDDLDQMCVHLLGESNGQCVAHSRVFPPGSRRVEGCLGGVCVDNGFRRQGLAQYMIFARIKFLDSNYPGEPIFSSVQQYRVPVYEKLGFVRQGEPYVYDNEQYVGEAIYHVDMLRP